MRPAASASVAFLAGVTMLCVSGCSSSPEQSSVASVARSFVSAVGRGDGAAACQLLTTNAQKSAPGATSVSCAKAIVSLDEHDGAVSVIQVWGDAAQVHVGDDVLFLRQVSGEWRVSAAGCKRQPVGPYDCTVSAS